MIAVGDEVGAVGGMWSWVEGVMARDQEEDWGGEGGGS